MKKYTNIVIVIIFISIVGILLGVWMLNWDICRFTFENPHMEIDYEPLKEIAIAVSKGESYPENENIEVTSNINETEVLIEVSYLLSTETKAWQLRAYLPIDEITFKKGKVDNLTIDYSQVEYEYINFMHPERYMIVIFLAMLPIATGVVFMIFGIRFLIKINKSENKKANIYSEEKC